MSQKNIGIFYNGSYLLQGNQLERCKKSNQLKANTMELLLGTDKEDCDLNNIRKEYKNNIIFHVPSLNQDLGNLKIVNELVRHLSMSNIELITINASNLSLDLFEWSTLEEQKKYFLNIVTGIATLASNKIEVAIDNLPHSKSDSMFGSKIAEITDIIVYSRKMLVKDFGFREEIAEKYIGLSLNIDDIIEDSDKERLENWIEIFNSSIKCIKISNTDNVEKINKVMGLYQEKGLDCPILLKTSSDLDDIDNEYINLLNLIDKDANIEIKEETKLPKANNSKKITNIIIFGIIVITIIIILLMFLIKLK